MQADNASTLCACLVLFFLNYVLFHANRFDVDAVFYQTDLIPLSVTFIKTFDTGAGKGRTLKTKLNLLIHDAVFNLALPAMVGLTAIHASTSHAGFLLSKMYITDSTIHPTRSQ